MECTHCHSSIIDDAAYCPHCGVRQPDVPECDTYDYSAFVSYRHRQPDTDVAARIHKAIEQYRLPAAVAQAYGAPTLGRAFRDQEELPATDSLPAAIRSALRHARSLVVVCSLTTPESRWVAQEIELFASYHGRDRIFAVLAEGASAESMPPALRRKLRVNEAGAVESVPTEPLAADMRAAAAGRFNQEKLRVIAGIASCSYDDLRQREANRKKKRGLGIAAAAIALAAVIGGLAMFAGQQHDAALVQESHRLAAESEQLLAQGDRYGAIETALEALTTSNSDAARPYTASAQLALGRALEVYPSPTPLQPAFSIAASGTEAYAVGETTEGKSWLAAIDQSATLRIFNLATGVQELTSNLKDGSISSSRYAIPATLLTVDNALIAAGGNTSAIQCVSVETGSTIWTLDEKMPIAVATSPDKNAFALLSGNSDDEALRLAVYDSKSGNPTFEMDLGENDLPNCAPSNSANCRICFSEDADTVYIAWVGHVARVDMASKAVTPTELDNIHEVIESIDFDNGSVVICSYATASTSKTAASIEALDAKLTERWSFPLSMPTLYIENGVTISCAPRFWYSNTIGKFGGTDDKEDRAMVFSASTTAMILSASDGGVLKSIMCDTPLVGIADDSPIMRTTSFSGRMTEYTNPLSGQFRESDSLITSTTGPIYSATLSPDKRVLVMQESGASGNFKCYTRYRNVELPGVKKIKRLNQGYLGRINEIGRALPGFSQSCDYATFAYLQRNLLFYLPSNGLENRRGEWPRIDLTDLTGLDANETIFDLHFSPHDPQLVYLFGLQKTGPLHLWSIDLSSRTVVGACEFTENEVPVQFISQLIWLDLATKDALCNFDLQKGITIRDPRTLEVKSQIPAQGKAVLYAAPGEGALVVARMSPKSTEKADDTVLDFSMELALVDPKTGEDIECPATGCAISSEFGARRTIALAPNARQCIAACQDNKLRCFSLPDGQLNWEVDFSCGNTQFVGYSPDGSRIIARDSKDTLTVLDCQTGHMLHSVDTASGIVLLARWSSDASRLFLITQSNQYAPSILQVFQINDEAMALSDEVYYAFALSQDESRVVACDGWGEFNIPLYTRDELVEYAQEVLAQHK